jgi:transcription initiation factor TFIIIB Brf1 subunit/transcription initiation factor TFIIB
MDGENTGRVNGIQKNGKKEICGHQRLVDDHYNEQGKMSGHLVCRECGAVLHDSIKAYHEHG